MSRITADVIDVLENEKTRVEVLDINGEDAGEVLNSSKVYLHNIQIWNPNGDNSYSVIISIYSCNNITVNSLEKLKQLFKNRPSGAGLNLPIENVLRYKISGVDYKNSIVSARLSLFSGNFIITCKSISEGELTQLTTRTLGDDTSCSDAPYII